MDSMMQMAYMSFATRQFKMDVDNNVNAILEEARANNSEAGITGLLVYRNGVFVQLLEGEKEVVQRVLGKILLDHSCLLYTSPSPRDRQKSRMPSSA